MAWGRRCDNGCESWPNDDRFLECPICREETTPYSNLKPLDEEEARQRYFEGWYATWCELRNQDPDGPLPMTPEETLYWDGKYPDGRPDRRPA